MTEIEWTHRAGTIGETWNPVVGCSIASKGCTNCYAMGQAHRIQRMMKGLGKASHYDGTTKEVNGNPVWTGALKLSPEHIVTQPLRWAKPRTVFVNSMSDLFHESMPQEWIDTVFAVMALTPRHTYQILTKRPDRMLAYLTKWAPGEDPPCPRIMDATFRVAPELPADAAQHIKQYGIGPNGTPEFGYRRYLALKSWPLPNVWLGTSCEDQDAADERVPALLQCPAPIHFVSAEPLLGAIDFRRIPFEAAFYDALCEGHYIETDRHKHSVDGPNLGRLDWIIAGGESGSDARLMNLDWVRSIVSQCKQGGTACFVKQLGAKASDPVNGIAGRDLKVPTEAAGLVSKRLTHFKGGDPAEWPEDLNVREMPA